MNTSSSMRAVLLTLVFITSLFGGGEEVEGKSTSWNVAPADILGYYWTMGYAGWSAGLKNFNVSVTRNANVYANGTLVSDGSNVSVGDTVSFTAPVVDTDISWFGTGGTNDSPYGHWRLNASRPPTYTGDYVSSANLFSWSGGGTNIYIPFSVHPSTITFSHTGSTAGLSCNGDGSSCTVTSAGSILTQVNYSATYGKFYYGYIGSPYSGYSAYAMRKCTYIWALLCSSSGGTIDSSDYILNVPSQQINFSLTAVSNNNPPTFQPSPHNPLLESPTQATHLPLLQLTQITTPFAIKSIGTTTAPQTSPFLQEVS